MKSKRQHTPMAETLAELFGAAEKGAGGPSPSRAPAAVDKRAQRKAWGDEGHSYKRGGIASFKRPGQRTWKDGPGRWWAVWESMTPGRWYAAREVPWLARDAAKLVRRGAAERTLHPDWTGRWQDGPKWLYRRVEGIRKPVYRPPNAYGSKRRLDPVEKRCRHIAQVISWQERNPDLVAKYARRNYERKREERLAYFKARHAARRAAKDAAERGEGAPE